MFCEKMPIVLDEIAFFEEARDDRTGGDLVSLPGELVERLADLLRRTMRVQAEARLLRVEWLELGRELDEAAADLDLAHAESLLSGHDLTGDHEVTGAASF